MSDGDKPKIEFPCQNYPIKVMGDSSSDFKDFVVEVMRRHDASFDSGCVKIRPSRNGRFESVNVMINATGVDQLQAIFDDLKQNPSVRMVL